MSVLCEAMESDHQVRFILAPDHMQAHVPMAIQEINSKQSTFILTG